MPRRKLIEVALPLDAINAQSAREKSIRHGHPSTLHLWWARRPLATARAVLFAQLVDDPSSFEEEWRLEAEAAGEPDIDATVQQRIVLERARLFDLMERMVDWDNLGDEDLFNRVRAEILKSTDGNPPPILDPFAGGGTIPLEAQRLGLRVDASDLNPVAVLINKALVEIPPKFADRAPVFPDAGTLRNSWPKAAGLAEDVRRYGEWIRHEAEKKIGHLYPKVTLPDGSKASVIAWIWARTVTCPNPACGIEMPLVRSWWLGKKKGKEAYVVPSVIANRVRFSIEHDLTRAPRGDDDGSVGRNGAQCVSCGAAVPLEYIRSQSRDRGLGSQLMATVAEGRRARVYVSPDDLQRSSAQVPNPDDIPAGELFDWPGRINVVRYGMTTFASLFTSRQLTALTTFSDLIGEARHRARADALAAGLTPGEPLEDGGEGATAYADAVATYLAFPLSRVANKLSALCSWDSSPKMESVRGLFARQAIPMAWDFAEANPFAGSGGDFAEDVAWVARVIDRLPAYPPAVVSAADAAARPISGLISTDPPYYDNIGYSDLSDFFYVWLRRSLRQVHPQLLSTMLVPKADELVANPYRHGGPEGAKLFFEDGFQRIFTQARKTALLDYPIAVYYAFKQAEADADGTASTGWETILSSMVASGWCITGTWPVRSELANRMIASGANALASSVVLALRPRPESASVLDRRGLLSELRATLPGALRELQQGSIAPVDLAQAAVGPGMAVYSSYARVIEPGGSDMSVRDALRAINFVLDEVLSEQEGDFDSDTRWCVAWFESHGFGVGLYGEAETLANAKNASVAALARGGVLSSGAGRVKLFEPGELPSEYDPRTDDHVSLWEIVLHIARALGDERGGLAVAGRILSGAEERGIDLTAAKELAYLLYSISEKRGMSRAGILFNAVGSSWPELQAAARDASSAAPRSVTGELDFGFLEED